MYNKQDACEMFQDLCGVFNVKCFGAVGNGVADDTDAIQEAIDSVPRRGTVYLPPGTYRITSALSIPSYVEIQGAGPRATRLKLDGQTSMMINAFNQPGNHKSNENITIRDLELDGNKENNPRKHNPANPKQGTWDQAGIDWARVSNSRIINCYVHDCAWSGITLRESCSDNEIANCRSNDNGNITIDTSDPLSFGQFEAFGIVLWGLPPDNNNRIISCTTNGNEKHGIEILGDPTSPHRDNLILGCHAADNSGYGIMINAGGTSHAASIIGCTCVDNAEGGIGAIGSHLIVEGNFLARNYHCLFKGHKNPPPAVSGAALNAWFSDYSTIANNTILNTMPQVAGNSVEGIAIHGSHNRVIGNLIDNVQHRGILFDGDCNLLEGNTVLHAGQGGDPGSGIQGIQVTGATVQGNVVQHCYGYGILFNGAGGGHRVTANQVERNWFDGVAIESQTDCVIEGNVLLNNGTKDPQIPNAPGSGIALIGTPVNTIISGNRSGNKQPPQATQKQGLSVSDQAKVVLAIGNILTGNTMTSILDPGGHVDPGPNIT